MTIPMASAYPASKAALMVFTRHLRMELAPFGIEVTNLIPGGVETPMVELGPEVDAQQWDPRTAAGAVPSAFPR
jgi:NAD(P)-dependent dehydrogenase (short-subunit alcohol dehydrogenase family)